MRAFVKTLINLSIAPIVAGTLLTAIPVSAEQVSVPIMSQGENRETSNLPRTGQTRESVEERFGNPDGTKGPTGEPPIIQLFYPDFVVYLEGDRVIHAVVNPKR